MVLVEFLLARAEGLRHIWALAGVEGELLVLQQEIFLHGFAQIGAVLGQILELVLNALNPLQGHAGQVGEQQLLQMAVNGGQLQHIVLGQQLLADNHELDVLIQIAIAVLAHADFLLHQRFALAFQFVDFIEDKFVLALDTDLLVAGEIAFVFHLVERFDDVALALEQANGGQHRLLLLAQGLDVGFGAFQGGPGLLNGQLLGVEVGAPGQRVYLFLQQGLQAVEAFHLLHQAFVDEIGAAVEVVQIHLDLLQMQALFADVVLANLVPNRFPAERFVAFQLPLQTFIGFQLGGGELLHRIQLLLHIVAVFGVEAGGQTKKQQPEAQNLGHITSITH